MKKLTTGDFIEKSRIIHKDLYEYSKTEYKNCREKVTITCRIHGDFKQTASNHMYNGFGCDVCARDNHKLTTISTKNLSKFKTLHNNKYQYNTSVINGKIEITCPTHGKFEQSIYHHLSGCGCPSCNDSKGEKLIISYLTSKNIAYIRNHTFDDCRYRKQLRFDFYLPDHNMIIEFDGKQHFEQAECFGNILELIKVRDEVKNDYCRSNNIPIVRVSYKILRNKHENQLSKLDNILSDYNI